MGLDLGPVDGAVLLEEGSATFEGIAAVAIVFMMLVVMAQAATALLAHRIADGAVAAAAGRVALDPAAAADEARRLSADLRASVPGLGVLEVEVGATSRLARARARFSFEPPGPLLGTIRMEVQADAPVVVAP